MDHPNVYSGHGGLSSFLNGRGRGVGSLPTVDQVAANAIGYNTRFPSIHLSLGGRGSQSFTVSGSPVREVGCKTVFDQMFVQDSEAAKKALQKEIAEQGSILDLVLSQAKYLGRNVNRNDREKLDEYLTAVRDAEVRLQGQQKWIKVKKPTLKELGYEEDRKMFDVDYEGSAALTFDLIRLAIQSQSSKVFTVNFGMHNRRLDLDGVKTGYHSLSHHGKIPDKLKQLEIIESFYVSQVSRFIDEIKKLKGENGNLLDDTMVMFGSALSDAARHSNRKLPIMIAGGGFKHQGHYNAKQHNGKATPLSNLYTTMLQNFGIEMEKYNTATGDINHILS